jgi:uncharacterized protein YodC (DUF2158 family)
MSGEQEDHDRHFVTSGVGQISSLNEVKRYAPRPPTTSPMKIGDIVRLKSGGPKMTITSNMKSNGNHRCNWPRTDVDGFGEDYFPPEALVKEPA